MGFAGASDLDSLQDTSSELLTLVQGNEQNVSQLLSQATSTCEGTSKQITTYIEEAGQRLGPQLESDPFLGYIRNAFDDIYVQKSSVGYTKNQSADPPKPGAGSFYISQLRAQNIVVTDTLEVNDAIVKGTLRSATYSPRPYAYWELSPDGVSKADILSVGTKVIPIDTTNVGYCSAQTIKPFNTLFTGISVNQPQMVSTCSKVDDTYQSFTFNAIGRSPSPACTTDCGDNYCSYMITPDA